MTDPDFEAWSLFVAVAEAGSFAGAARARGLSVPTVSRGVARLEERLGAALFHRTSRRLSLSALGQEALGEAQALVLAAQRMEERLGEATQVPAGTIRVAAPLDFGRAYIAPLLPQFLAKWPGLSIELYLDDARIDIVGSGHDLVLRIGKLADSSLIARRLCAVQVMTVAAPAYLQRAGRPAHPADLGRHQCMRYLNSPTPSVWQFEGPGGADYSVTVSGPLATTNGGALLPALLAGEGIGMLPDFLVWEELAAGRLEQILPDWSRPGMALFLVTPPSPLRPQRVRLLMDWLAERLQRPPWQVEKQAAAPAKAAAAAAGAAATAG